MTALVECIEGCGRMVSKFGPHGRRCKECRSLVAAAEKPREPGDVERAVLTLLEPARAVDEARERAYAARGEAASAADEYREAQITFRRALEALARPRLPERGRVMDVSAAIDTGGYRDDAGRPV